MRPFKQLTNESVNLQHKKAKSSKQGFTLQIRLRLGFIQRGIDCSEHQSAVCNKQQPAATNRNQKDLIYKKPFHFHPPLHLA